MTEPRFGVVALTGAAGRIGQALRPMLAPQCRELRLLDQVAPGAAAPNERAFTLQLQDRAALDPALAGCDAVVHFAGYPREAEWDVLLPANVQGVIHLWESALAQGVQRIVYASSNHAMGLYPRSRPVHEDDAPLPDSRYGVSKVFMEGLAAMHAIKHGLRGFGLRIGYCAAAPTEARMLSHWIHPQDLAQLVEIGLAADYTHEIVYGASANSRSWWPNRRAAELGYRPAHSADAWEAELSHRRSANPIEEHYQGGSFAAQGYAHDRLLG